MSATGAIQARTRVLEEALSVMLTRDMFSPEARRLAEGVLNRDSAVVAEVRRLFAEDPLPDETTKGSQVCSDCNCTDGHFWPRCTETKGPGLTDNSPNGTLSANAPSGEPS